MIRPSRWLPWLRCVLRQLWLDWRPVPNRRLIELELQQRIRDATWAGLVQEQAAKVRRLQEQQLTTSERLAAVLKSADAARVDVARHADTERVVVSVVLHPELAADFADGGKRMLAIDAIMDLVQAELWEARP